MSAGISITATAAEKGRHITVAANGVGVLHSDKLDLQSATSRKRFTGATMQVAYKDVPADDWPADVRHDRKATARPGALPPGADSTATADISDDRRVASLAKMPADVRGDAEEFLADPKILERAVADITAAGVVGESRLTATLYLIGVSAQLPRPLSAIIRGPSAGGKSYIVEQTATWFPPEVVLHATSLTTNALYYFEPGCSGIGGSSRANGRVSRTMTEPRRHEPCGR